jgi:molecular chaperone HscB
MADLDHFERLGLPRRFLLDDAELERNYLARSRQLHPDFHHHASTAEQHASIELTARLNQAVQILRDPFRRAEYLLQVEGGPSAAEQKDLAHDFLEEVMDLRMQIEELKETEPQGSPQRLQLAKDLADRRDRLLADLAGEFETLGNASGRREQVLRRIRTTLNAMKFLQNLIRDLDD